MKILNLTKFYYPKLGGMETVVKNITESNIKNGFVSDVLCSNDSKRTVQETINKSNVLKSSRLFSFKSASICPFMPWQLKTKLNNQYDILHVHFPDPMTALSLFLCKPSTPFVIHWHSDIIKQKNLMLLYGPLQKWCLDHSKYIIVTSEEYFKHSHDLVPYRDKIKVIPIGIESDKKFNIKMPSQVKTILSVGRLTDYKGFSYLIEAANYLPDNYQIKIIGDGELRDVLNVQIEKLKLNNKVQLLGSISNEKLDQMYSSSDLFCLPSVLKSEAFGVVLLEAMSNGLPLVTCNIDGSGVSWVNQQNSTGLNVKPRDPKALAEAITKILEDNNLYQEYSRNSYERYRNDFTLSSMMNRIWEVYKSF
jgi:rhamnosyl/mannosyltransferase